MTPMNTAQTIQTIEDAIAFTKAADAAGLKESVARKLLAELGALPPEQVVRMCKFAAEQKRLASLRVQRSDSTRRR